MPGLRLRQPVALGPRLFFEVFSGPNAIAYAHLSTRAELPRAAQRQPEDGAPPEITYFLKNIEVCEAYRNRGVGSALLHEVVRFCREAQVSAIYGEAKGDLDILRRWYGARGFEFDHRNQIHPRLSRAA